MHMLRPSMGITPQPSVGPGMLKPTRISGTVYRLASEQKHDHEREKVFTGMDVTF